MKDVGREKDNGIETTDREKKDRVEVQCVVQCVVYRTSQSV